MTNNTSTRDRERALRDLYPSLNEGQIREAEENLDRYMDVVLRIYTRIDQQRESDDPVKCLTTLTSNGGMESERSTNENNPFPTP